MMQIAAVLLAAFGFLVLGIALLAGIGPSLSLISSLRSLREVTAELERMAHRLRR